MDLNHHLTPCSSANHSESALSYRSYSMTTVRKRGRHTLPLNKCHDNGWLHWHNALSICEFCVKEPDRCSGNLKYPCLTHKVFLQPVFHFHGKDLTLQKALSIQILRDCAHRLSRRDHRYIVLL